MALAASLDDIEIMGETVEQGCRHRGIAEYRSPCQSTMVGGDDQAGAFIELTHQVKEQGTAGPTER